MKRFGTTNDRNYDKEAREMLRQLNQQEKYKMYEIVLNQQTRSRNEDRDLELAAVRTVIESDKSLDKYRLKKIERGETGMSADISNHDLVANNKPKKKKS